VHAPFPEAGREGQKGGGVTAVFLVAFGPGLVAAAVVGGEEEDLHGWILAEYVSLREFLRKWEIEYETNDL
jgi:hypothetical protein